MWVCADPLPPTNCVPEGPPLPDQEFSFEAEFALLDVGATTSMLRSGALRPSVLLFSRDAGVESIALSWTESETAERAFEEARRFARDGQTAAYALIAHYARENGRVDHILPGDSAPAGFEHLGMAMFDEAGNARGVSYPIRRSAGKLSFGMPVVTDAETTDWCPIGDIWTNPFCVGDTVRFRPREQAVDPSTPLWQAIVELTRMRIHDDQPNAEEYMAFLDDLRNGIFVVLGRPVDRPDFVVIRPRTLFNPLGVLQVEAARLLLSDRVPADVEKIEQMEPVTA